MQFGAENKFLPGATIGLELLRSYSLIGLLGKPRESA